MRFGDFVRNELKNPKSEISKATKRLKNWKTLIKSNNNLFINWNGFGIDLKEKYKTTYRGCGLHSFWTSWVVEAGSLYWVGMLIEEFLDNKTKIIDT